MLSTSSTCSRILCCIFDYMLSTIKVRDVGLQISINVQHADINADGIERQIKARKYTDISYRTE